MWTKYHLRHLTNSLPALLYLLKAPLWDLGEHTLQTEQIELILREYVEHFFGFAMRRTNNAGEAEELSQEIAFQVVTALRKAGERVHKLDAYLWSIAHNTYKRWLWLRDRNPSSLEELSEVHGFVISDNSSLEEMMLNKEASNLVRREISRLAKNYRQVLVDYYYNGLECRQIAKRLGISSEMVRFYLMKARMKVKEGIEVFKECGEKSYNPGEFHIYYSGIDWATINIWKLFSRRLPGSIVTTAYDRPMSISEISVETGVPAVYLEDEIKILMDVNLMQEPVKGKYQTSFFILKREIYQMIIDEFGKYMPDYADKAEAMFIYALPHLRNLGVFQTEVSDSRYKWLFLQKQKIIRVKYPSAEEYPRILADGSRAFIWGQEAPELKWGGGISPIYGDGYTLYPIDIGILGYRLQRNFSRRQKCEALYDIAIGRLNDTNKELYAELIAEGYAIKDGKAIRSNIPVLSVDASTKINRILDDAAQAVSLSVPGEIFVTIVEQAIKNSFTKIVQGTPRAYASLIAMMKLEAMLLEAMYDKGYIAIPEIGDNTPMTSYIELM